MSSTPFATKKKCSKLTHNPKRYNPRCCALSILICFQPLNLVPDLLLDLGEMGEVVRHPVIFPTVMPSVRKGIISKGKTGAIFPLTPGT